MCISPMFSDVEYLFLSMGHMYVFFGKVSAQILCPWLNRIVCFILFCGMSSMYFGY